MLVTITNLSSSVALGVTETLTGGSGIAALSASGGNVLRPMPYPFNKFGSLAASGTKQLAVHPRDLRYRGTFGFSCFDAGENWQIVVNNGQASFTVASESTRTDSEEKFINAV